MNFWLLPELVEFEVFPQNSGGATILEEDPTDGFFEHATTVEEEGEAKDGTPKEASSAQELIPTLYLIQPQRTTKHTPWKLQTQILKQSLRQIDQVRWIQTSKTDLATKNVHGMSMEASEFSEWFMTQHQNSFSEEYYLAQSYQSVASDSLGLMLDPAGQKTSTGLRKTMNWIFQALTHIDMDQERKLKIIPLQFHITPEKTNGAMFYYARNYAVIRAGAPIVVKEQSIEIYQEDPVEYIYHLSSRLELAFDVKIPRTGKQIKFLRLCRNIYKPAKEVWSRRQIACVNEEILQIHLRTAQHPGMSGVKEDLVKYLADLKKRMLIDQDILDPPSQQSFRLCCWTVLQLLCFGVIYAHRLVFYAVQHFFYANPKPKFKQSLSFIIKALRIILSSSFLWLLYAFFGRWAILLSVACFIYSCFPDYSTMLSGGPRRITSRLMAVFVYSEETIQKYHRSREKLVTRLRSMVSAYSDPYVPLPIIVDSNDSGKYKVNFQHSLIINSPKSFANYSEVCTLQSLFSAPSMLQDKYWRLLYETFTPQSFQRVSTNLATSSLTIPVIHFMESNPVFEAYKAQSKLVKSVSRVQEFDINWRISSRTSSNTFSADDILIYEGTSSAEISYSIRDWLRIFRISLYFVSCRNRVKVDKEHEASEIPDYSIIKEYINQQFRIKLEVLGACKETPELANVIRKLPEVSLVELN